MEQLLKKPYGLQPPKLPVVLEWDEEASFYTGSR